MIQGRIPNRNIGILIEFSIHVGVLFLVSLSWSCVFEVKFILLNFYELTLIVKHKHVSYVNLSFA